MDERLLESQRLNNGAGEGGSSWVGRLGPPDDLNEVMVDSPTTPLSADQLADLDQTLASWRRGADDAAIVALWTYGLSRVRMTCGKIFQLHL